MHLVKLHMKWNNNNNKLHLKKLDPSECLIDPDLDGFMLVCNQNKFTF